MASPPGSETLYAAVDGRVEPVSARECVFRDARSGTTHLLPSAAVEALDACRAFAPLAAHATHVAERHPAMPPPAIAQGLEFLVSRGLLVSDADFLGTDAGTSTDDAPLRAVFVRACDRPAQLGRLLASLAQNEAEHGGRHRYVVLDDSRDPAASRAHAQQVRELSDRSGAPAIHVDDARWNALVARLGEPAPSAARIALARDDAQGARFGGGKGCNLAALLGAGARYVLLDDDFALPLRRADDALDGLALDASPDGPARFHASVEDALADGRAAEGDPFEQARRLCGDRLGAIWRASPWRIAPADLAGFAPSLAPHVRAGARVATLTHGHRGDSGAPSSRWMYLLDADSRRAFARDPEAYARNRSGAGVWYAPRRARVDARTAFTPFAIDARTFVPPTRADGRSEDQLFGALLAACDANSVALHTNLAIGHRQERPRDRAATLAQPTTPLTNQWLAELLHAAAAGLHADAPPARLRALAAVLRDVGSATPARQQALVADYVRFVRADMASRLSAARDEAADAPDYWKRDVDRMIETHRRALLDAAPARFADWADGDHAVAALRPVLGPCAELFEAWPALFDHAARCAESLLQE